MNPNEIHGFAFGRTISSRVLYGLKNIDCCYLVFGIDSINGYLKFLIQNQPKYILGMGTYGGIDQNKIRIEEICTNKFRNSYIEGGRLESHKINSFLELNDSFKLADGIGNSYCNYISYQITKLINNGDLKSKYTFLHIPKTISAYTASKEIDEIILPLKNKLKTPKTIWQQ